MSEKRDYMSNQKKVMCSRSNQMKVIEEFCYLLTFSLQMKIRTFQKRNKNYAVFLNIDNSIKGGKLTLDS